jgi:hypothetical protein
VIINSIHDQVDSESPSPFDSRSPVAQALHHLHLEKVDEVVLHHILILQYAPALVDAFADMTSDVTAIGTVSRWGRHRGGTRAVRKDDMTIVHGLSATKLAGKGRTGRRKPAAMISM